MRIVSLAPSNTEILYALDAQDDVIGVTRFCDHPPAAKTKTIIGGWLDADLKKVVQLNPDLVLTSTFLQDKAAADLTAMGVMVVHVDPKTLGDVVESFITIGAAINRQDAAEELVARTKERLDDLRRRTSALAKPRVYIEEWHKPSTVSGNWVPELLDIAGGRMDLIAAGERSAEIDTEDVVRFDPEHIIASWCGFGLSADKDWITQRPGYAHITAVKNGNIHVMDDSLLNRPGPRIVDGAQLLARLIHSH
ncbi:MAG: cobalamin-binding protein [Nanoarchaeota archaeon]